MRFIIKSLIALASTAAVATGTTVAVKKNEKLSKIYDEKMPEFAKNNLKTVETKSVAAYTSTKTTTVDMYRATEAAVKAGSTMYSATRVAQRTGNDIVLGAQTEMALLEQKLAALKQQEAKLKASAKK